MDKVNRFERRFSRGAANTAGLIEQFKSPEWSADARFIDELKQAQAHDHSDCIVPEGLHLWLLNHKSVLGKSDSYGAAITYNAFSTSCRINIHDGTVARVVGSDWICKAGFDFFFFACNEFFETIVSNFAGWTSAAVHRHCFFRNERAPSRHRPFLTFEHNGVINIQLARLKLGCFIAK